MCRARDEPVDLYCLSNSDFDIAKHAFPGAARDLVKRALDPELQAERHKHVINTLRTLQLAEAHAEKASKRLLAMMDDKSLEVQSFCP